MEKQCPICKQSRYKYKDGIPYLKDYYVLLSPQHSLQQLLQSNIYNFQYNFLDLSFVNGLSYAAARKNPLHPDFNKWKDTYNGYIFISYIIKYQDLLIFGMEKLCNIS